MHVVARATSSAASHINVFILPSPSLAAIGSRFVGTTRKESQTSGARFVRFETHTGVVAGLILATPRESDLADPPRRLGRPQGSPLQPAMLEDFCGRPRYSS